jgi:hypothetical protein
MYLFIYQLASRHSFLCTPLALAYTGEASCNMHIPCGARYRLFVFHRTNTRVHTHARARVNQSIKYTSTPQAVWACQTTIIYRLTYISTNSIVQSVQSMMHPLPCLSVLLLVVASIFCADAKVTRISKRTLPRRAAPKYPGEQRADDRLCVSQLPALLT